MTAHRSSPLVLLLLTLLTVAKCDTTTTTRTAQDMTLAFYRTLLTSSVSEDTSTVTETDWRAYTEWDWKRSLYHETNETKKYPFLLCDDKDPNETAEGTSMASREKIVEAALNLTEAERVDLDLADYLFSVLNSETKICVVGSFFSSLAAGLEFVVQPISFLMKINSGTTRFSSSEYSASSVAKLEYFVVACPGLTEEFDKPWWQGALRDFVPWLDELIAEGALPGQDELLQLQEPFRDDSTYCDTTLENDVRVDRNATGYALLSLTTAATFKSRACFQVLAYALAAAPEICYIERAVPTDTENEDAAWSSQSNRPCDTPFFDVGLTGKGQVVGVSDSGLDLNSCYFADARPMTFGDVDDSRRKVVRYVDFADTTDDNKGHGTHVAGTIAGHRSSDGKNNLVGYGNGIAPGAKLSFVDLGETGMRGLSIPNPMSDLIEYGRGAGARIHSASWGSMEDKYSVHEQIMDAVFYADDRDLMVVAAGNSGPDTGTLGSPAKAKNVLTVGATKINSLNQHELATFSSRGPTQDNRIKPDVVAFGSNLLSAGAEGGLSCEGAVKPRSGNAGYGTAVKSGTSMATPVVSGSAALVRQYFADGWHGDGTRASAPAMDISGVLLKAIIINGARPMKGYALNEVDSQQGFGLVSLVDSVPLAGHNAITGRFLDLDTISEGTERVYRDLATGGGCGGGGYEFSVTLSWFDAPGIPGCRQCLLNDLDLRVVQTSVTGDVTVHYSNGSVNRKDGRNNNERIRFNAGNGDEIVVTVWAAKLNEEVQSYALAAVSSCEGFVPDKPAGSICDALRSVTSGADYVRVGWMASLVVFVWFPLFAVV